MSELPIFLHTAAQIRDLEHHAIASGVASYTLMHRAGKAALHALQRHWPLATRITIVCGRGNNAGDGYVLARLARAEGMTVIVTTLFDPVQLGGDAHHAWRDFIAAGGSVCEWSPTLLDSADVVVDAILGTGLSRPLDDRLIACINCINATAAPKFAIDIPSGLHADSGAVLGAAVHATRTLTFVGLKLGFYVGVGPDYVGSVECDSLEINGQQSVASAQRISTTWLHKVLPRRERTAHKGRNGHVLLIAGGEGMAGAACLAGEAALRVGAGLVTVATSPANVAAIVSGRPELIVRGIDCNDQANNDQNSNDQNSHDVAMLIAAADVIAIGPGLGQSAWAQTLFNLVLASDKPLVVDADALNLLAQQPRARGNWILTPHPGEAARLLAINTAQVQADRMSAAQSLAQRYKGIVVLKGAGSIVMGGDDLPFICDAGNPGMATAGMGDVLTGVIAALQAQCNDPWIAARAGVLVHALAGDIAALNGERGLIASDVVDRLRMVVNPNA